LEHFFECARAFRIHGSKKVSVDLFTSVNVEGLYWYAMQIHNITFALLHIIFIYIVTENNVMVDEFEEIYVIRSFFPKEIQALS